MSTQTDQRGILQRHFLKRTAHDLKAKRALTLTPSATVDDAIKLMVENKIGSVLVVDQSNHPVGIFTERDILFKITPPADKYLSLPISELMTPNPVSVRSSVSIARLLFEFHTGRFRHIPILEPDGILSVISIKDVVDYIHTALTLKLVEAEPKVFMEGTHVDEFFTSTLIDLKPDKPVVLSLEATLAEALTRMREYRVGAIVIKPSKKKISGIFTERDYINKVVLSEKKLEKIFIEEVMTPDPKTVLESNSIAHALNLMSGGGFRHLPVVNDFEEISGVLSLRTFFNHLLENLMQDLNQS